MHLEKVGQLEPLSHCAATGGNCNVRIMGGKVFPCRKEGIRQALVVSNSAPDRGGEVGMSHFSRCKIFCCAVVVSIVSIGRDSSGMEEVPSLDGGTPATKHIQT